METPSTASSADECARKAQMSEFADTWIYYSKTSRCHLSVDCPTNTASVHLVMGCVNAREGVVIVKKKHP